MKKTVILLLLCLAFVLTATTSKADFALMNRLRQNASQFTNLASAPDFPCYDVAYSWTGNTLYTYLVYATSYSDYTLVSGTVTFYFTGDVNYSNNGGMVNDNFSTPGPITFSNGENVSQFGTEINSASLNLYSPTAYNGYPVYCQEGEPQ